MDEKSVGAISESLFMNSNITNVNLYLNVKICNNKFLRKFTKIFISEKLRWETFFDFKNLQRAQQNFPPQLISTWTKWPNFKSPRIQFFQRAFAVLGFFWWHMFA